MVWISHWETRIQFPQLLDLAEHSFGISEPNVAWNIWNFEWYQFFILLNPVGHRGIFYLNFVTVSQAWIWGGNWWLSTFNSAIEIFFSFRVHFYSIIVECIQYLWKQLIASKSLQKSELYQNFPSTMFIYVCQNVFSTCVQQH